MPGDAPYVQSESFTDFAFTTLAADYHAGDPFISLVDATNFPGFIVAPASDWFLAIIPAGGVGAGELILIDDASTTIASDNIATALNTRGMYGTAINPLWSAGSLVTCGPLSHHLADLYTHLTDPFLHHVGPWESWMEQTTLINAVAASPQWIEGAVLDSPLVIPVHQKFRFILDGLMVSATPIHKLTFIVSSDLFNPTTTVVWETIFDPRATGITLPFHAESGPLTLLPDNQYILSAYADGAGVTGGGILGTSLTPFGFRLVALP